MIAFFDEGLRVQDEVEVAEALLALTCEVDGHLCGNFVVACGILGIDKWVMVR